MRGKNGQKNEEGFLFPFLAVVSGWLQRRTLCGFIRTRYPETKNRGNSDKWVLGNFASSILLWLITPYVGWVGYLFVACAIWRICESVLAPTQGALFGREQARKDNSTQEILAPERNAVYALMTYAGLSFWFAILYMKFDYLFNSQYVKLSSSLGSWYFSVVTMSTLGYGEIVPKVSWGGLIVVFQTVTSIFFALIILGSFISWMKPPEISGEHKIDKTHSELVGAGELGSKEKMGTMSPKVDQEVLQSLLALYNVTQGEINWYRDRQWRNVSLFVVTMVGVVGFVLAKPEIAKNFKSLLVVFLVVLAIANIYYNSFTHWHLTRQRNVQKRIEYVLGFADIRIRGKYKLHPFKSDAPDNNNFLKGWTRGFWHFLLPVFVVSILLAGIGIYFLYR